MFRTICTQVVPLKRDDTDGDTAHDTPYDTLRDTAYDTPYDTRRDTAHDTQCGHIPRLDQTRPRPD